MSTSAAPTDETLEGQGLLRFPLANLLDLQDPLEGDVWGVGVIDVDDVRSCAEELAVPPWVLGVEATMDRDTQIARIAYLVRHGWVDATVDETPIVVDIGEADYTPLEMIVDGNHRVAAAFVRGDDFITVEVRGDWDKAIAVFQDGEDPDMWGVEY